MRPYQILQLISVQGRLKGENELPSFGFLEPRGLIKFFSFFPRFYTQNTLWDTKKKREQMNFRPQLYALPPPHPHFKIYIHGYIRLSLTVSHENKFGNLSYITDENLLCVCLKTAPSGHNTVQDTQWKTFLQNATNTLLYYKGRPKITTQPAHMGNWRYLATSKKNRRITQTFLCTISKFQGSTFSRKW